MKTLILLASLTLFGGASSQERDCSDAHSSADEAYSYCKKAYESDSWDDTKGYLKKAMNSFNDATSYADEENCNCDAAQSAADDGYSYAKKGYYSTDWEDSKTFAKKAKDSADEIMSSADDCQDED